MKTYLITYADHSTETVQAYSIEQNGRGGVSFFDASYNLIYMVAAAFRTIKLIDNGAQFAPMPAPSPYWDSPLVGSTGSPSPMPYTTAATAQSYVAGEPIPVAF